MQFEILKKSGIDIYSGFRKTSQGGAILIPKKEDPPLISKPGSAYVIYTWRLEQQDFQINLACIVILWVDFLSDVFDKSNHIKHETVCMLLLLKRRHADPILCRHCPRPRDVIGNNEVRAVTYYVARDWQS